MNDVPDPHLDAALRDAFVPPAPDRFAAMARAAVQAPGPGRRLRPFWPWVLAVAAALLVLSLWPRAGDRARADGVALGRMWAAAFVDAEARGFGNGNCCEPVVDLGGVCQQRFAARLALEPGTGLSLLGCYCGLPTGESVALLASAGDAPVCVCVVPRRSDPRVELDAGSGLHLARREVGELVVYALSRRPVEHVLGGFVEP